MDEKPPRRERREVTAERIEEVNRLVREAPKPWDGKGIPPLDVESDDYAAKPE